MDLSTPRKEKRLKNTYVGTGHSASYYRYKPLKILHFELCSSWLNKGKECLVAQVRYIDIETGEVTNGILWTESYTLIDTIKGTEPTLPHYTKIIQKRDRYYYFVTLNDKEKTDLLNV